MHSVNSFSASETINVQVSSVLKVDLSCSQKRKSEDLNGEATNKQNELKKEEDVEEVEYYVQVTFKH